MVGVSEEELSDRIYPGETKARSRITGQAGLTGLFKTFRGFVVSFFRDFVMKKMNIEC